MDPFENIARQRQLAKQILTDTEALEGHRDTVRHALRHGSVSEITDAAARSSGRELAIEHAAVELAELVTALDEWQGQGGFSPYPITLRGVRLTNRQVEVIGIYLDDDAKRREGDIVITRSLDDDPPEETGTINVGSTADGSGIDITPVGGIVGMQDATHA